MASSTKTRTGITCTRIPTAGWMTIGKNSSGTNQDAQLTFAALGISNATITGITLRIPWNNTSAGEGFAASVVHQATINGQVFTYTCPAASGSVDVSILAQASYMNANAFTVDLRGQTANASSTSKGYDQDVTIIVTYTIKPNAPTTFTATPAIFEGDVTLSWSGATAGEGTITGYNIEYGVGASNPPGWSGFMISGNPFLMTTGSGSHVDSPVTTDGYYMDYRIQTICSNGEVSAWKEIAAPIRKNRDPGAPGTPTVSTTMPAVSASWTISWTAATEPDAQAMTYDLEQQYSTDGGTNWTAWAVVVNQAGLSFTIGGGVAGNKYRYRVRAKDSLGAYGPYSGTSPIVTKNTPLTVPGIPVLGNAFPKPNELATISWAASTDANGHAITYNIERDYSTDGGTTWLGWASVYGGPELSCTISNPNRGQKYRFRVNATDSVGDTSAWSGISSILTINQLPNTVTSALTLNKTIGLPIDTVRVSFTNPGDPNGNAKEWRCVMRYATGVNAGKYYGGDGTTLATAAVMGTNASPTAAYVDVPTNWARAGKWNFVIYGVDVPGEIGAASTNQSATYTVNSLPGTPTITAPAAAGPVYGTSYNVTWTIGADADGNLASQELQISTDAGATWGTAISLAETATSYSLNLGAYAYGTALQVRVRGKDDLGEYGSYATSPTITRTNRVPNTITSAVTADKTIIKPGDTIRVSFTNAGDPDGNMAGVEICMQYPDGRYYLDALPWSTTDPALASVIASGANPTATYVDKYNTTWTRGGVWHFLARGYDTEGARGAWSTNRTAGVTVNSLPGLPTWTTPSGPATVGGSSYGLAWTPGTDADGNQASQELQISTDNGSTWGAAISLGAAVGTYSLDLTAYAANTLVKVRVRGLDALGEYGSYATTGTITVVKGPSAPTVQYPTAGRTLYAPDPYILVTTGAIQDPGAANQVMKINIDGAGWVAPGSASAANWTTRAGGDKLWIRPGSLAAGSHTIQVQAVDSNGQVSLTAASVTFTVAVPSYSDTPAAYDPAHPELATRPKVATIVQTRAAIDTMRLAYGYSAYAWSAQPVANVTPIVGAGNNLQTYVTEMRTALQAVFDRVNGYKAATLAPAWEAQDANKVPRASIFTQLRSVLRFQ